MARASEQASQGEKKVLETLAGPKNTERIRVSLSQVHVIAARHFLSLSSELFIFSRIFFVCMSNIYTHPTAIISSKVTVCSIRNTRI